MCRLVKDDDHPYLAYSPIISIKDSSEPFRAFLGAILSVVKDFPVERSAYNSDLKLDIIVEEEDDTSYPATPSQEDENRVSDLIVHPFLDRYLLLGLLIYS